MRTAAGFIIPGVALLLSAIWSEGAGVSSCLPATTTSYEASRVIYQEFPARGPTETAWVIVWTEFGYRGLWIEGAWFRPKPGKPFIQVLGQSGLSNIFVPYHEGANRFYDLNKFADLREAVLSYTGPCGTISGPSLPTTSLGPSGTGPPRPVLIKEIRDRGVAWTTDGRARRGEEVLLWSVSDAGNYEYIIQYGFRDDGTITFRLGSTGYNSPVMPNEPHMHNALWYLDINLGHADHNSVRLMAHVEPAPIPLPFPNAAKQASDFMPLFNNGTEGFADWKAEEFTGLNIMDTQTKNARGHEISYDLMPLRTGTARHEEPFSQHDFWVTQNHSSGPLLPTNEIDYDTGLLSYINGENITDTDVAVWHISSNHHMPRDEDHEFDSQGNWKSGIAQLMWSGFDLEPRNLLDDAPLFGCLPVPPGLVGWWPFEEALGASVVADIKTGGAPNNGAAPPGRPLGQGGPTPVQGAVGRALNFDGTDDYIEINDSPSLNFGVGDFSADYWIRASPKSWVEAVLDKRVSSGSNYTGYHLFLYGGKPGLQLAAGTGGLQNYIGNVTVSDGFWHHIAITVNRTGSTKEIRWYVDGQHVDTSPSPILSSLNNSSPLRLGARSFSPVDGFLNGILGEFELYNRVLTPAEIRDIYAAGKCR